MKRLFAENNMNMQYAEDLRGYSSKEVVVEKKGLLGKIKLGFNYIESKLEKSGAKMESIYIKYHDLSKRKFV